MLFLVEVRSDKLLAQVVSYQVELPTVRVQDVVE
jgi:hypothetical protein